MNETIKVDEFNARFEELDIWVSKIEIERINDIRLEVLDKQTATTGVWHNANFVGYPDNKQLVGKFFLILRNQGEDFNLALWVDASARVSGSNGSEECAVVCKYLQFLFGWMKEYVEKNGIEDRNGKPFIVPEFHYSKDQFLGEFPG